MQTISIGDRVGRYEVRGLLARGGMGAVYVGDDPRLNRKVVIKAPIFDDPDDPDRRSRLRREAQIHGYLLHENVVRVYDFVEGPDQDFIVSEFVEGGTLATALERVESHLRLDERLDLILQIARGLSFAHDSGVVHRDLKVENVLLSGDIRRGFVAKITDFGLSRLVGPLNSLRPVAEDSAPSLVGTLLSMSPEQTHGEPADHRSDLFSLGVLSYQMLAGRLPFEGRDVLQLVDAIRMHDPISLREVRADIPHPISRLVHRLLAKRRVERPSASEVVEVLDEVREERRRTTRVPGTKDVRIVSILGVGAASQDDRNGELDADTLNALRDFHLAVRRRARAVDAVVLQTGGSEALIAVGAGRAYERPSREALDMLAALARDLGERALKAVVTTGTVGVFPTEELAIVVGSPVDRARQALMHAEGGAWLFDQPTRGHVGALGLQFEPADRPGFFTLQKSDRTRGSVELIGREREEEELSLAATRVRSEGIGQSVVIVGEAGIGKTALVERFLATPGASEIRVLRASGSEGSAFSPYGLVLQLLTEHLSLQSPISDPTAARRLLAARVPHDPVARAAAAHILQVASVEQSTLLVREIDRQGPSVLPDRLSRLLVTLAGDHPTAWVIEDLHWADSSSLQTLRRLVAELSDRRGLLVVTGRPSGPKLGAVSREIRLERLRPEDAERLARSQPTADALSPELLEMVLARAEGVPLWVKELATNAALRDGPADGLAASARALVQGWLDDADRRTRRVAKIAAALGRQSPRALLAEAAELASSDLEVTVQRLARMGLMEPVSAVDPTVVFRHALLADAVYEGMDEEARVDSHRAISGALESGAGPHPGDEPALFATHHEKGGYFESAIAYWKAAGRRARRLWAHPEAVHHLDHALELSARFEDIEQRKREEFEILESMTVSVAVTTGMSSARMEALGSRLEQLRGELGEDGDVAVVFQNWAAAWLAARTARMDSLLGVLEGRLEALLPHDPMRPLLAFMVGTARGLTLFQVGRLASCLEVLEEMRAMRPALLPFFENQDRTLLTVQTSHAAFAYALCGRYEEGKRIIEEDRALFGEGTAEWELTAAVGANTPVVAGDYAYAHELALIAERSGDEKVVANAYVWARLYRLVAEIHLRCAEAEPAVTDVERLLTELIEQVDAVSATGNRTGLVMNHNLALQVALLVDGDERFDALSSLSRRIIEKSLSEAEELLQDPEVLHSQSHGLHLFYAKQAEAYRRAGDETRAREARLRAERSWDKVERLSGAEA